MSTSNESSGQAYQFGSQVSPEFKGLFKVFAAAAGTAVADQLTALDNSTNANVPLLIVGGTQMMLFKDATSDPETIVFRGGNAQGFNEITAISHIGVAMGYFAQLKSQGKNIDNAEGVTTIEDFKVKLEAVIYSNEENAADYWVNKLTATDNPYLVTKKAQIRQMIDYACKQALHYINQYRDESQTEYDFSYESLIKYYYKDNTGEFPIGDYQIMVGTFNIITVDSAIYLKNTLATKDIDWKNAILLINGQSGGTSSGLNVGTSSTYALLEAIAGTDLSERTLFAPYAKPSFDTVLHAKYTDETAKLKAFKDLGAAYRSQFYNLIARNSVATKMFGDDIPLLPQTYPSWAKDAPITVETLLARMKTCMTDARQLLSNCTTEGCLQLLNENNWDSSKIRLPGFDLDWK
jgi:hypothetical protein